MTETRTAERDRTAEAPLPGDVADPLEVPLKKTIIDCGRFEAFGRPLLPRSNTANGFHFGESRLNPPLLFFGNRCEMMGLMFLTENQNNEA